MWASEIFTFTPSRWWFGISDNALVSVDAPGYCLDGVTVCREVNHLGMLPTTQINSAFYPPWDGKMSISFWAE